MFQAARQPGAPAAAGKKEPALVVAKSQAPAQQDPEVMYEISESIRSKSWTPGNPPKQAMGSSRTMLPCMPGTLRTTLADGVHGQLARMVAHVVLEVEVPGALQLLL